MSEKMIGSLIYGDHPIPKKQRPLKQRILFSLTIGIAAILVIVGVYKFVNYREEGSVKQFLADVRDGNYEKGYATWDLTDAHYSMKDFMEDWGKDGYYGKALATAHVADSNSRGSAVIVYVRFSGFKAPIPFLVDKHSLKLSFSATNKYVKTQKSDS